jgi:hypothetical protein
MALDAKTPIHSSTLSPLLMECSEFERATISLSLAKKMLQEQEQQQSEIKTQFEGTSLGVNTISSSSVASAVAMRR